MTGPEQLLADYVKTGSEGAFRDLVSRYIDLVYSAAIRLVNGDAHLAEDVAQTVFADLARMARKFSPEVMLGGWLHRHTCFVAANTMRGERRRQNRERQAAEMNAQHDHSAANLEQLTPILDDAINQLGAEDRSAILLRFFEQRDFRSVGEKLGSNEEAARKRVGRALEKLHTLLTHRGVTLSAATLATTLSTQAIAAAPTGLAMTISGAALASAATGSTMAITILNIMSMTKLKIGIVGAIIAVGIAVPVIMQNQAQTRLHEKNEALRQKAEEVEQLAAENERLLKLAAQEKELSPPVSDPSRELVKLRGEVGRLRQENANVVTAAKPTGESALGEMLNPEMKKMLRDQQKLGLGYAYKAFALQLNLPNEQADKLNDLLADNVMENIDHITAVLRDGKTPEEMEQVFAAQESALLAKVEALLGPEAFAEYQTYTHNLTGYLTGQQFQAMMNGDAAAKTEKGKQIEQLMKEETQQALASAGLPSDYQTAPTLNFRNFASEKEAEKNLGLLDNIYERVAERASAFLSPEEIAKFGDFRTQAIGGSRMMLAMNRKMMSPGSK